EWASGGSPTREVLGSQRWRWLTGLRVSSWRPMGDCASCWHSRSGRGESSKLTWSPTPSAFTSLIWESSVTDGSIVISLKSILHNIAVVLVGFALAYLGTMADSFLGFPASASIVATAAGWLLVTAGFLLRVWATFYFYRHNMRVIALEPQTALITSGPYRFSRNPLYVGGNVFIFFGAALILGSPAALFATALHLPLMDRFIRREEKQLGRKFSDEW